MDTIEWAKNPRTIKKSSKQYAHFDYRTNMKRAYQYVLCPEKIAQHGFYPFIHYEKDMSKYGANGLKQKKRDICYAAHLDRCIYQYYSFLLNERYNERLKNDGIWDVPVAYRTDLGVSNIQIAKRAFDYIRSYPSCYVMIGDFTSFFDRLNHRYLKKQWCNLLGVTSLPSDHYAVFKSVTKYQKWELDDLLELNGLENSYTGREELNSKRRVLPTKVYHSNKTHIIPNSDDFGIPQGSPISAILANIYMLDVDKTVAEIAKEHGGLYMRYSDDFIVIIPNHDGGSSSAVLKNIVDVFNKVDGLTLEPTKTQFFKVSLPFIQNNGSEYFENADCKHDVINFLGFTFDGERVSIRSKTVGKYYYRMYRKAKTIAKSGGYTSTGKHISNKNLYMCYSERGAHSRKGNFFTYVEHTEEVFGENELLRRDVKNHMSKIRHAISKPE